jgi:Phosphorylated adapter RNA export protein, RNA-binding domain
MQPEDSQKETVQPEDSQKETVQPEDSQKEAMTPEDIQKEAQKIAKALGETADNPIKQIALIIEKCGLELAQKVAEETEKIEADGGMKTHDGKRRRTKGGTFFFIIKGRIDAKVRQEIFPNFGKHSDGEVTPPGIEWSERIEHLKPLLEEPGQVNNLTVTLIGRPGKIHIEGGTVMTVIEQKEVKAPPYPKGVPPFESVEPITTYYVFISLKHWQKVEKALEDETDMLIVEGTSVYDAEMEGICLLTTSASTKGLERQRRLTEAQEANQKKAEKSKKPDSKKAKAKPVTKAKPPKELSGLPASVSDKLKQLHSAADTLRQKIVTMEEKGQKTGLNMTRRLLEQTEKQIATLEKQYEK